MSINSIERKEIIEQGVFLEKKGYSINEDNYTINYVLKNKSINIAYPPNSDESDINIKFLDKNNVFSIGWIALVRSNMKGLQKN